MLIGCVPIVRIRTMISQAVCMACLLAQLHAQDKSCKVKSDQVPAAVWEQMPPPPGGVTVAFYDDPAIFVGLNHAYAQSQNLTHRWLRFVPWMSAGIVSVFPFGKAVQSPASRMPLFYVSHTAAALDASQPDAQSVHLVRAVTKNGTRVVQVTSGVSSFSFRPGFTTREEVPLRFDVLSKDVYTIQPVRPLDDGEYFVIFGPTAGSGFEFEIACSSGHRESQQ
jgi:hypothetical protein